MEGEEREGEGDREGEGGDIRGNSTQSCHHPCHHPSPFWVVVSEDI